jgi:NAD(P)H-dependent FMN reductase
MSSETVRLAVILGSTRHGRRGCGVAEWVHARAAARADTDASLVDLADFALPVFDEPEPPMTGRHVHPHTAAWSEAIAGFDAFVFVTPEYNRSIPGALKNAIDFLYYEWNDKAAGFVSYGTDAGGARAVEHLRVVMGELRVADVRAQVALSLRDDFEADTTFAPREPVASRTDEMLDQVVAWGRALRTVRDAAAAPA